MIWKDVIGFEGLYMVSDDGQICSLCSGRWKTKRMRKLISDKDGYMTVCLKKNGKYTNKKVHRLVAEAFIPNVNSEPCINHKDCNRANNHVTNLEWCSYRYNNLYMDKYKASNKPVNKLDDNGNVIKSYESMKAAGLDNGIDPSLISPVVKGKRKKAGGFKWEYQY